jgi:Tc toxin complex TcA C-terminal TcB-binding domain/Neuraminidase-like domain/Putative peptidoglycan binding domain
MELQGRDLTLDLRGDDVRSLHDDLVLLGYQIPDPELAEGVFGDGTLAAVVDFQMHHRLGDRGVVDDRTARAITAAADPLRPRVVRGRVADAGGRPAAGTVVVAVDVDLRSETELGRVPAGDDGAYEITYTTEQLGHAGKQAADLLVRALRAADGGLLAASPVVFGAKAVETVDLVLPVPDDAPSELERYLALLEPVLHGMPTAELGDADVDFLAAATGIAREHLAALAAAARREAGDAADPDLDGGARIPAGVYYAWFRQGLPANPDALWTRSDDELVAALTAALDQRLVPRSLGDLVPTLGELAGRRRLAERLRPTSDGAAAGLGDLLATMPRPLSRQRQVSVASVLAEVLPGAPALGARLEAAGLSHAEAVGVQRTLLLGDLTLGHAPLVRALQERVAADDDVSLRALAAVPADRWLDLAYTHGTPGPGSDSPDGGLDEAGYAASLERRVEALHPTATLAAQLAAGRLVVTRPGFGELGAFLTDNPTLDVVGTPADTIAAEARFNHVEDKDQLVEAVRQLQRLKALDASWRESGVLLNAGVGSARELVALGRGRLGDAVAGQLGQDRLDELHAAAVRTQDTAITVMMATLPQFWSTTPAVGLLSEAAPALDPDATPMPPTLRGLFGDLDVCDCQHCGSVLSPAAYLVDLLELVRPSTAALSALLRHRPDLLDLELSCENTTTELPQIDLALEILENAAALPREIDLPVGTDAAALLRAAAQETQASGSAALPAALAKALRETALDVPDRLAVSAQGQLLIKNGPSLWVLADRRRRWSLTLHETGFFAARPGLPPLDKLPFPPADAAATIAALDGGTVPASLQPRFEAFLRSVHPSEPVLGVQSYTITQGEPGSRWRVRYTLSVAVLIEQHDAEPTGTLTLADTAGAVRLRDSYSSAAMLATATALGQGKLGGVMPAWLGASAPYKVTEESPGQRWTVSSGPHELELHYQADRLTIGALVYQSAGPDADLLAAPQNRNPAAYRLLRTAEFPWSLPFDLPLSELRAYLDRLGLPRGQLLELLAAPAARLADDAVARETLGLSKPAADLADTADTSDALWRRWGLTVVHGRATIRDTTTDMQVSDPPLTLVARVSILLQQAGLDLGELQDVLQTRFVQGSPAAPVTIEPPAECAPSKLTLRGVTAAHLDRIHRFVRLWRALGWTADELDLALMAVQPGAQDGAELLRHLAHLARLRQTLGLGVEVLAAWWGGLGSPVTTAHTHPGQPEIRPLYDRLFGNPLAGNPSDPAFRLTPDRSELAVPGGPISGKAAQICAALGLRQDELQALLAAPAAPPGPAVPDTLTLANLSRLHAIVTLSRALGLAVADYPTARRLTGIDPFAATEAALRFAAAVAAVHQAGFTVAELAAVLRDEAGPGVPTALGDDHVTAILATVRAQLQDARAVILDSRASLAERLQTLLTRAGWPPAAIDQLLRDASGRAAVELPDEPALLDALHIPEPLRGVVRVTGRTLETLDVLPAAALDSNDPHSLDAAVPTTTPGYAGYKLALDQLRQQLAAQTTAAAQALHRPVGMPGEPLAPEPLLSGAQAAQLLVPAHDAETRHRVILKRLLEREQRARVVAEVARGFDLDEATVAVLLLDRLHHPDGSGHPAVMALADPALAGSDPSSVPDRAAFPAAFALARRLQKVALLCRQLGLGADLLAVLPAFTTLDLDDVPVEPPAPGAASLFDAWWSLATLGRLARRGQGAAGLLAAYAVALTSGSPAAVEHARAELADRLELDVDTVTAAATQLGLATADHGDPRRLEQLVDLLAAARRTGATPAQLAALGASDPDEHAAALARELLRGKHGAAQWPALLRPISDTLRERQRDALVDHLVARDGRRDADDLYGSYLLDVQMAPCAVTTRILQATAAVQLFVQRCLLNLEQPEVPPTGVDANRWAWMKSYRVWEANRKVFLYPENWLLPELRDDKTQAFQELEGSLGQSEPSHEHANEALLGYLDDLAELAQVTVVGLYEDDRPETGTQTPRRALYAVGRSPNQPYRYFWRACEGFGQDGMRWSGWERLEADIPGDHVLPFVFEGDLHVAWPVISKQGEGDDTRFEVQLAWVRRTGRGWTRRKVSRDPLRVRKLANRDERSMFAFRVAKPAAPVETVEIRCYAVKRDVRLDLTPSPEANPPSPGAQRLNINPFTSFYEYSNPRAYDYATGVVYEGLGFEEAGDSLRRNPQKANDWLILEGITARRSGSFVLDGWGSNAKVTLNFRARLLDGSTADGNPVVVEPSTVLDCTRNFVFPRGQAPPRLSDAEIPLDMNLEGVFTLASGGDVEFGTRNGSADLKPLGNTYLWMSGYREVAKAGQDGPRHGLTVDGNVFGASSPERFFVLPGGPWTGDEAHPRPWYFQEAQRRYYLDLQSSQSVHTLTVYPDAYPEGGAYRRLAAQGLPALFAPQRQATTFGADQLVTYLAGNQYALLDDPRPPAGRPPDIGFSLRMPYANYHWELFVHAPLRIADELARQQRFEDALGWLHHLFDPTTTEPPDPVNPTARFWKALPLQRAGRPDRVAELLAWLLDPASQHPEAAALRNQIAEWERNPFRPDAVARLRPGAYQWRVLFSYLDVLIAWGDELFRRDTRESIAEATQLYVLAARLLGPPSRVTPDRRGHQGTPRTYRSLSQQQIAFADAWEAFADTPQAKATGHGWGHGRASAAPGGGGGWLRADGTPLLSSLGRLYFCVPPNEKLLGYWGTVSDRLFKIRHCQSIEGVARELALWEPPIDPELLVRATAAGVDIAAILADRAAPLAPYRFSVLAQKAGELCAELKSLGAALLAALEKRDAEQLALLRAGHEVELLKLRYESVRQQANEADAALKALRAGRRLAAERWVQYQRLLGRTEIAVPAEGARAPLESPSVRPVPGVGGELAGLGLTQREVDQLNRLNEVQGLHLAAGVSSTLAGLFFVGAAGWQARDKTTASMLEALGRGAKAIASGLGAGAEYAGSWAAKDAILGGYERRRDEWSFQSNLVARELEQIDQQIAAAALHAAIAQQDLATHQRQTEQAEAVDELLRDKYTNELLYGWMVGRLAEVYRGTYRLALDAAKRAERAFRYELGVDASSYVRAGYWDSLKHGLLAGEHLTHDLARLETAWLEQHRREHELTRNVSLLQVDPLALVTLKETGACEFELPETLFDLDFPGHYFRRIKSVSLSVPCVVGPYGGVNATLTLLRSSVRHSPVLPDDHPPGDRYARAAGTDDGRFTDLYAAAQSIATSSAQNDAGVFELSLRDERYLPFEGEGAISRWRLELADTFRPVDYDTITDVVLHLRYTARPGGEALKRAATDSLWRVLEAAETTPLARLLSLRHELPGDWHRFLNPPGETGDQTLSIPFAGRFPLMFQNAKSTITITRIDIVAKAAAGVDFKLALDPDMPATPTTRDLTALGTLLVGTTGDITASPGTWTLTVWRQPSPDPAVHQRLARDTIQDILLICHYTVTVTS